MMQSSSRGFWHDAGSFLPGALTLCLASLASGGLGALLAVRCIWGDRAPTLWQLVKLVFVHTQGR
jgi:hypothetical protein